MGLPRKSRVPFPISELEMLERREEADRLKPLCRVLLKQPTVCGRCRGDKPSQMDALRKGRKALPTQRLRTIRKLHVVRAQELPSHPSCYAGGVSQNSGIYQGFAVSMWLLWLGLVCKTNKGSTIHRQLIASLNSFTLTRSRNQAAQTSRSEQRRLARSLRGESQPLWAPALHHPSQFSNLVLCVPGQSTKCSLLSPRDSYRLAPLL